MLRRLRRGQSARFSELMRPTGLTSDSFKFHLRRLQDYGWLQKMPDGSYSLTPAGKELANNLDEVRRTIQKQPKLSVLIVAERTVDGISQYLLQRRLRQPYYGFWGLLSGPVGWGESLEAAAQRELLKQTGFTACCTVRSFLRVTDGDDSVSCWKISCSPWWRLRSCRATVGRGVAARRLG